MAKKVFDFAKSSLFREAPEYGTDEDEIIEEGAEEVADVDTEAVDTEEVIEDGADVASEEDAIDYAEGESLSGEDFSEIADDDDDEAYEEDGGLGDEDFGAEEGIEGTEGELVPETAQPTGEVRVEAPVTGTEKPNGDNMEVIPNFYYPNEEPVELSLISDEPAANGATDQEPAFEAMTPDKTEVQEGNVGDVGTKLPEATEEFSVEGGAVYTANEVTDLFGLNDGAVIDGEEDTFGDTDSYGGDEEFDDTEDDYSDEEEFGDEPEVEEDINEEPAEGEEGSEEIEEDAIDYAEGESLSGEDFSEIADDDDEEYID